MFAGMCVFRGLYQRSFDDDPSVSVRVHGTPSQLETCDAACQTAFNQDDACEVCAVLRMGGKILPAFAVSHLVVVGGGGGGFRVMCRLCFPLGRNILWDVRELKNKSLKFEFVGCYPPEEQVSVGLPIPNLHPSPLFVSCPPANDCFVSSLPLHRSSQSRVNNHLLSSTHGHGRLISAKFPPRWLDTPCVVDFAASQENLLGRLVLLECPT